MFMKKSFIYLLLISLISGCEQVDFQEDFLLETLFENNDKRLLDYHAVKNEDKTLSWSEEFDNNDSKWPFDVTISYSDATLYIEDGKMIIDYYGDDDKSEIFFKELPIIIDESKNFEVEMRMYWKLSGYALYVFDHPIDTTMFYGVFFSQTENGIIRIRLNFWDKEKNSWSNMLSIPANNFTYPENYNLITIRKIGMKYSIFVNEKFIYAFSEDKFSCNPTDFSIHKGINKLDYFRLSYVKD